MNFETLLVNALKVLIPTVLGMVLLSVLAKRSPLPDSVGDFLEATTEVLLRIIAVVFFGGGFIYVFLLN